MSFWEEDMQFVSVQRGSLSRESGAPGKHPVAVCVCIRDGY